MEDFYEPANSVGQEIVNNRNTKNEFIIEKNANEYEKSLAKEKEIIGRGKMSRKLKFTLWILFGITIAIIIASIVAFSVYASVQITNVNPAIVSSLTNSPNILDYPKVFPAAQENKPARTVKFNMDENKVHLIEPRQTSVQYSDWNDSSISSVTRKKKSNVIALSENEESDDEDFIDHPVFTLPEIRSRNRVNVRSTQKL